MNDSKSLLYAAVLSFIFLFMWEHFISKPQRVDNEADSAPKGVVTTSSDTSSDIVVDSQDTIAPAALNVPKLLIDGDSLSGSIELIGLKFNELTLRDYQHEDDLTQNVALFMPSTSSASYYSQFGFLSGDRDLILPGSEALWKADRDTLISGETATLSWTSPQDVTFNIYISLDDHYMFNVRYQVINNSDGNIRYNNYGLITRTHVKSGTRANMMVHEGGIGVLDETLREYKFKDIAKKGKVDITNESGWIGFSDKYWLSAMVPAGNFSGKFARYYNNQTGRERFQADYVSDTISLAPGQSFDSEMLLFAGAKELKLIEGYKQLYSIPLFDRAVDFGWLYFITKPIFLLLNYFYSITANFGYAIILLTIFIKALLFPLAYKGFKGMNRLKDLQPKMAELKKRYEGKPQELQRAMMELYKKEKVNPLSGCLPLLLQMPVFFALYKVLYVNIEMRQAYFFGWITDLSAPDPASIFNLFGLLPIDLPSFLTIGVLPILMSLSMYLQQKLSPQPTDPTQAMVMKFLPLIFLVMFASFPSGLVLYITLSNVLSILQQVAIKKFA